MTMRMTDTTELMYHALSVAAKDAAIRRFLVANDPMALRQIETARLAYQQQQAETATIGSEDWRKESLVTADNLTALGAIVA